MGKMISLDTVKADLEAEGYRLLSNWYQGAKTPMDAECPRGHRFQMTRQGWKAGNRCPVCADESRRQARFLTPEDAQARALEQGYKLAGHYTGRSAKTLFQCLHCGTVSTTSLKRIVDGQFNCRGCKRS